MKYLVIPFLFLTAVANAQLTEKQLKELHDNTAKIESTTIRLNESINASIRSMDSENMARAREQMSRNRDTFMAARKEQEQKKLQRMYWRLGAGVLMLVVLFAGWRRKKS